MYDMPEQADPALASYPSTLLMEEVTKDVCRFKVSTNQILEDVYFQKKYFITDCVYIMELA